MTGYRQLARNRDFTVLWIGETVSELGNRTSAFAYPLVALALTGSAGTAALVQAAYFGGTVAVLLPAGALVDRVHRGRLLRTVSLTGFVVYAALATTLATGTLPVAGLVLGALVAGGLAGLYEPAQVSAVRSVVTTDELPTALAQNQARGHVAGLAGAPLGGVLLGLGRWMPFALDAATYLVSFLTLGRIRTDLAPATRREGPLLRGAGREVLAGARYVARHPVMRVLAVWSALGNLVVNGLLFVVLVRLAEAGHGPAAIGAAMAVVGAAGILGAAIAPTVIARTRTGRLTVAVGWSCAVPLVPLVWWATPVTAAACVGTLVLLNPIGNAGIGAYRMSLTPPELQGRVAATTAFLSWSLMPFAPLLGGALLAAYGGSAATAVFLGGCLLTALLVTCSASVRRVPRPVEWATAA